MRTGEQGGDMRDGDGDEGASMSSEELSTGSARGMIHPPMRVRQRERGTDVLDVVSFFNR